MRLCQIVDVVVIILALVSSCASPNSSIRFSGKWRGCDSDSLRCYWFDFNGVEDKIKITIWQDDNAQSFEGSFDVKESISGGGEELVVRFAPLFHSDSVKYFEAHSYLLREVSDSLILLYFPAKGQAFSNRIRLVPRL